MSDLYHHLIITNSDQYIDAFQRAITQKIARDVAGRKQSWDTVKTPKKISRVLEMASNYFRRHPEMFAVYSKFCVGFDFPQSVTETVFQPGVE